jgi:hypothetical protein
MAAGFVLPAPDGSGGQVMNGPLPGCPGVKATMTHIVGGPLPPEASLSESFGVSSWCDSYYDIGPTAFTFVRFGDFWRPSYRGYYLPPEQNLTIINRTKNITDINYNNNVINNNGPQYQRVAQIAQQQGHPLETYKVNYAAQTQRNAAFKTAVQGNQLNVVAPP